MNELTKNILIIGKQGSGKSYLAKKWQELGVNAVDADKIEGLGDWYDADGTLIEFNKDADAEWIKVNSFLWDKSFLEKYLDDQGPIIILGSSRNALELKELFDDIYYLKVPGEIIEERLQNTDRTNPHGSTKEQRQVILRKVQASDEKIIRSNIKMISGTQTPEEILEQIEF